MWLGGKIQCGISHTDGMKLCTYLDFSPFVIFSGHCHIQSVESGSSIIFADLTSQEEKSCDSTSLENVRRESVQNMDVRSDFANSNSKECVKPDKCELSKEGFANNVNGLSAGVDNHSTSSVDQDVRTESESSSESKSCSEGCSKNEVALYGEFEVNTVLFKCPYLLCSFVMFLE